MSRPRVAWFARACSLLLAFVASGLARADWTTVEERWYALTLADRPCGRSLERVEKDDGGRFRTTSRVEMRFARLGQETRVDFAVAFTETAGGHPVEAVLLQADAEVARFRFEAPSAEEGAARPRGAPMRVVVERGTVREERTLPSSSWLTPREVSALLRREVPAGPGEIRYETLDIQSGLVVAAVTMVRRETEAPAVGGAPAARIRFESTSSVSGIRSREQYDASGVLVESAAPIGLGDLVARLGTRADADRSYAEASFDLLAGTFVSTDPIEGWDARGRVTYELRAKGDALIELPSVGAQRYQRLDGRTARVEVDTTRTSAAREGEATDPRYLAANATIDFDHPEVRALLGRAGIAKSPEGAARPSLERADALRGLVYRHLSDKNFGSAFASASESARARGGDCTEHAVLLAALLRAEGIPSRVVSGLVYVPDLAGRGPGFSWHLWTQALVEPPGAAAGSGLAWVDLDATLPGPRRFHAAHVAVATTDLAGGASDPSFAQALSLVGGVTIEEAGR